MFTGQIAAIIAAAIGRNLSLKYANSEVERFVFLDEAFQQSCLFCGSDSHGEDFFDIFVKLFL